MTFLSENNPEGLNNYCGNCGKPIAVSIFKGSGHCSDLCRKVLSGEITKEQWISKKKHVYR